MLEWIFLFFPPYALGNGLVELTYNQIYNEFFDGSQSPLEMEVMGMNVLILGLQTVVFFLFNIALEYGMFSNRTKYEQVLLNLCTIP